MYLYFFSLVAILRSVGQRRWY